MVDDAQRRTMQWLEAAPGVLERLSGLFDEHSRLRLAVEAAERECSSLHQELATVRAENEHLLEAARELDQLILDRLGQARDARLRSRAPLTAPVAAQHLAPAAPARTPAAAAPAQDPEAPSPRRILLVDDDAHFRSMIMDYLADHGEYEVVEASNGEEALALIPDFQPQLVLLDLAMPGGGTWAIERIKALHPGLCVIVATANDDVGLARRARMLGASDYLMKPFDLDDLGMALDAHMTEGEASLASGRSLSRSAGAETATR